MTSSTHRRRAEQFAAVIERDPPSDGAMDAEFTEFTELRDLVTSLRNHDDVAPRAEFAGDLRVRLLTEARTVLAESSQRAKLLLPVRRKGPRVRRLVAAASVVVFTGGTATMAAAAQNSIPGEALYPVKRGIERADVWLSSSEAGKGSDLLAQANARLSEVEGLLASDSTGSGTQVPGTLSDFTEEAHAGAALLLDSFEDTQGAESVRTVRFFAAESMSTLVRLVERVPAQAEDELATAAVALQEIDAQAATVCASCLAVPPVAVPEIILARVEFNRVLEAAMMSGPDDSLPVAVPEGAVDPARVAARSESDDSLTRAPRPERLATGEPQPTPAPTQAPTQAPTPAPIPAPTGVATEAPPNTALPEPEPLTPPQPPATEETVPEADPDPSNIIDEQSELGREATRELGETTSSVESDVDDTDPLP
ncbi:MAG: DUF5667 domain-containing protein [Actinomycetota bacterium]|nr:DUF5667 domain-containing protein [Actinomycetota bacterium]